MASPTLDLKKGLVSQSNTCVDVQSLYNGVVKQEVTVLTLTTARQHAFFPPSVKLAGH